MRLLLAALVWVAVAGSSNWLGQVVQRELDAGRHLDHNYLIMDSLGLLPHLIPVAVLLVVLPRVAYRPHADWPERRAET